MNFFETLKQFRVKQSTKNAQIASLTDEHFWQKIEALDTINCPECQSNIIDEPYLPNKCNICSWTEDGSLGNACTTVTWGRACEGEVQTITDDMSICFTCNTAFYSATYTGERLQP